MEFPLLLGDFDDWVRIIVILIFILGPILNAVGGAKRKQQPGRPGPLPRPGGGAVPPRQVPAGQPQAGQGRQALENEIEDFLRRAGRGEKRPKAARPPEQQPPQPVRRLVDKPRPVAQPQPAQRAAPPKQGQPGRGQPRQGQQQRAPQKPQRRPAQRQRRPLGEGVGQHVKEHIESHPVSEHSRQLGRSIAQADEKVEDHLHQVFDHSLGQLDKQQIFDESEGTDSSVWNKRVAVNPAVELRKMLSEPDSIRNAIVLAEIFKRPPGLE